jgi:hypothetical protein
LIAQYLGRHLSGEPGLIVQNMPGANSIVAANYVYNIAQPDGLNWALSPEERTWMDRFLNTFSMAGARARDRQRCQFLSA